MVRPNSKRISKITYNLNEVIDRLNDIEILINTVDITGVISKNGSAIDTEIILNKANQTMKDAFRGQIINLFVAVEEYLAFNLKASGFAVNNETVSECLNKSLCNSGITSDFLKAHKSSLKYRNNMAHRYNEPSTEELLIWWGTNKKYYSNLSEHIRTKYVKEIKSEATVKDMGCF